MDLIGTAIVGFFAGLLARFFKPGNDRMGFVLTTVLGILGAVVGTLLGQALGIYQAGEPAGFIGAVVGAIILLALIRAVVGRRK